MNIYNTLHDYIQTLKIIDTHEHLPFEADRPKNTDVLAEWLTHYFSSDLISAGITDNDLAIVRDSSKDIKDRWKIVEPYWHAAESTGYGRSLSLAAKDLYGIEQITEASIENLNQLFQKARTQGGHYNYVLKDKSGIALSIRDSMPVPYCETEDMFAFTMNTNDLICPSHYADMRKRGMEVGIEVHTLADWMDVTRRYIEKYLNGHNRVVCLKSNLAYYRSLRFDKVTQNDAEKAFNEFFSDGNLPDWRSPIKAGKAFSDWMMHFVCRVADDNRLVYQIHTGLHEGNGNVYLDWNVYFNPRMFQ